MTLLDTFSLAASISTAVGIPLAVFQIRTARIDAVRQFEDGFSKEYRELANRIPTEALLGVELSDEQKSKHFDELYRYFDLCNEQIYLRQKERIRVKTWRFWCDGMKSNFAKPAFRWAWEKIEFTQTKEFSEFRKLAKSEFKDDPKKWHKG